MSLNNPTYSTGLVVLVVPLNILGWFVRQQDAEERNETEAEHHENDDEKGFNALHELPPYDSDIAKVSGSHYSSRGESA